MITKWKNLLGLHTSTGPVEYLVVGLGNPGKQYEHTRHNAGFLAVDHIAKARGFTVNKIRFQSWCGEAVFAGKKTLFLKPATFMNNSGQAVRDAARFYKIPMEKTLVIYDDASLPPGGMRIRRQGSDGGQKGVKSIIYLTGEDTFPRIKIGIGAKPYPDMNLADWVLHRFTKQELEQLEQVFGNVLAAAELIVSGNIDEAMNRFNAKQN